LIEDEDEDDEEEEDLRGPVGICRDPFGAFKVDGGPALKWISSMLLKHNSSLRAASFLLLLISASLHADVKLPALFSDNMVLQQGMAVPVWGWADEGETVTVRFRNQTARTTAKDGKWMVKLRRQKAGGPDTLTVSGRNSVELKNVLVGEVWVCSGQSNMEWPMNRSFQPQQDIQSSAHPQLRLFTVPKLKANDPAADVKSKWVESGPNTVSNFSAVAYYFGRDLQKARGVPVGLIHTSWGGSPAEVWMSRAALESNPRYKSEIVDAYPPAFKRYEENLGSYEKEAAELAKEGKKPTRNKPAPPFWKPTELYNGMIAPLIPYAIKGAIWYQGESNAGRAEQYRSLFADMIRNWRRDWGQGDFTFLAVQLAPWDKNKKRSLDEILASPGDSDWAELREAQGLATKTLPKVGLAVITDVGDKDDIHPTKKEPVGARLALAARGIAYGERIVYAGPVYRRMKVQGDKISLTFDNVGKGLQAWDSQPVQARFSPDGKRIVTTNSDGTARIWDAQSGQPASNQTPLKGFAICGPDKRWVWANAEIQGSKVVVSSPAVSEPVAVRYGWSDFPVVNLWNKNGLPASPFRTDNFPLVTQGKK
jgi:sialate O-acetylesterase